MFKPICNGDGSFTLWLKPSRYVEYLGYVASIKDGQLDIEEDQTCMSAWIDQHGGQEEFDYTKTGLIKIRISFKDRGMALLFKLRWG